MKPQHFETRHIKVTIHFPTDKHLDLNDSWDYANAIKSLFSEWQMLDEDIRRELFNVHIIHNEDKKRLVP